MLDEDGELPKVFRMGMLRSDSASSLNRLLKDLENNPDGLYPPNDDARSQNSGFEQEERLIEEELKKLKTVESGNTSENNSLMGDTPSNYNEANLRFHKKSKQTEVLPELQEKDELFYEDPSIDEETKPLRRKKVK